MIFASIEEAVRAIADGGMIAVDAASSYVDHLSGCGPEHSFQAHLRPLRRALLLAG